MRITACTENKPKIRSLTLFQDRNRDVSSFEELTQDYIFEPLKGESRLRSTNSGWLKICKFENLQAFHKPGKEIRQINDFQVHLE